MARQKLTINFDTLFPGEVLTIGSSTLMIRPLNIKQISTIMKQLDAVTQRISQQGITFENYNIPANLFKIAIAIMEDAPEVLAEASDVELEDLLALPLDMIIVLLETVVQVNLKSKDDLVKNFLSLTKKLIPTQEVEVPEIQK